jgi:hypothetical protein
MCHDLFIIGCLFTFFGDYGIVQNRSLSSKSLLLINLTKEVKDLYNENYRLLKKEINEDIRR